MSCKEDVNEWRHAVDVLNSSSHKFPGMEENILPILKFSYDGLEDEKVKSCYLYCSLFPEDYEIKKEELIEFWISEGFIDGNRDEDGSSNQGYAIICSLVRAHLLMEGELTMMVKMHDVLREMALWIGSDLGKGERIWVKSGTQLRCIPEEDIDWEVVRRISLMNNEIEEISTCPNCPNLSTLLLRNNRLAGGISGTLFHSMCALVVLDLSGNLELCELPEDIANLSSSLLYLSLAGTRIRSLPVGLNKLISLDLEFTSRLVSIDGVGTSFPNLQVLRLFHSSLRIDEALVEELKLLQHLKVLTATIEDGLVLESIQREERLASCIQGLCLWDMSAEVVTLNTAALGALQRLEIYHCRISEIEIVWESKKREEIRSTTSSQGCFKHLSTVRISYLEDAKDLTWLLLAPDLRYLHVTHSSDLEEIINEEKGMSIINDGDFEKLESLELRSLVKLERICWDRFPYPRKFVVEDCPKLLES